MPPYFMMNCFWVSYRYTLCYSYTPIQWGQKPLGRPSFGERHPISPRRSYTIAYDSHLCNTAQTYFFDNAVDPLWMNCMHELRRTLVDQAENRLIHSFSFDLGFPSTSPIEWFTLAPGYRMTHLNCPYYVSSPHCSEEWRPQPLALQSMNNSTGNRGIGSKHLGSRLVPHFVRMNFLFMRNILVFLSSFQHVLDRVLL